MAVPTPNDLAPTDAVRPALLALLVDGRLHSGEELAAALGVSRAAVWKAVARLRLRGIDIDATPRQGYALRHAVELLDAATLQGALRGANTGRLRRLTLLFDVDSTNTQALALAPPPHGSADVVMSELQHAGRGRRGRRWIAPFGCSIALSLSWNFADAARASPALSLCVGIAVVRALERAGARGVGLKWPNDIWHQDRKVGGVLLELRAEASGPAQVVIGVGLNVRMPEAARREIEASGVRVAAVADACETPPSRNLIAGAIIDELLSMLVHFEREGFAPLRDAWQALDVLRDRRATVLLGENSVAGIARGVDAAGALRLESHGRVREFVSGEVSLRLGGNEI